MRSVSEAASLAPGSRNAAERMSQSAPQLTLKTTPMAKTTTPMTTPTTTPTTRVNFHLDNELYDEAARDEEELTEGEEEEEEEEEDYVNQRLMENGSGFWERTKGRQLGLF